MKDIFNGILKTGIIEMSLYNKQIYEKHEERELA